jgi:hypothetical protein
MANTDGTIISILSAQLIETSDMEDLHIAVRCLHDFCCATSPERIQSQEFLKRWVKDCDLLKAKDFKQDSTSVQTYFRGCLSIGSGPVAAERVRRVCSNFLHHEYDAEQVSIIGSPLWKHKGVYLELREVVLAITNRTKPDSGPNALGCLRVHVAALRLQDKLLPLIAANHCRRRAITIIASFVIFAVAVATLSGSLYAAISAPRSLSE